MTGSTHGAPINSSGSGRRIGFGLAGIALTALAVLAWNWHDPSAVADGKRESGGAIHVVAAEVTRGDIPVRLAANGTVSAQQMVVVRPQLSAMIRAVHIREGEYVRAGQKLFTLDARTEDANLNRMMGQLARSRADLLNAERNLERQRELFRQNFISRAALEVAENQVDGLRAQLAVDRASLEAGRVARGFSEIVAPISGRTGVVPVYQGSLVQPNDALVTITQVDPINVNFTLPEREFVPLQQALAKGQVIVTLNAEGQETRQGHLIFMDNVVDTASGTIVLKAEFPNADRHLWPGMFVGVTLSPRQFPDALRVPVQAVQTGPENTFVYTIRGDGRVEAVMATVRLVQDGIAVIEGDGIAPGMRVVVEGAQNLKPGSLVTESDPRGQASAASTAGGGPPGG